MNKQSAGVGFGRTEGTQRKLTIRERLGQIAMSKQSGELNHVMLGRLVVTSERAAELSELYTEEKLIRLKRILFMPEGVKS